MQELFKEGLQTGLYVYGQGTFADEVAANLESLGFKIHSFVDYQSPKNLRIEVIKPPIAKESRIVVLGFHNFEANISQITQRLAMDGFSVINVVEYVKFLRQSNSFFENYWLTTNFQTYTINHEAIVRAGNLLKDEKSTKLFFEVIKYRLSGDESLLAHKDDLSSQYFPEDIPWLSNKQLNKDGLIVLDGGAFRGETYLTAKEKIRVLKWIFVEPDENNQAFLDDLILNISDRVELVRKGLHRTSTSLNFETKFGSNGSKVSETGDRSVSTVSIDHLFDKGISPLNLVKLDIEGSELAALEGGLSTIAARKPYLAVSIYHKPEDHWEIPLFVAEHFPFYDLYVRLHGEQTFDAVLYCVPK